MKGCMWTDRDLDLDSDCLRGFRLQHFGAFHAVDDEITRAAHPEEPLECFDGPLGSYRQKPPAKSFEVLSAVLLYFILIEKPQK